jgi:hypothetical protein
MGSDRMNRFIESSPVVTINNYYTIAEIHNLQSLHTNLLSLFPLVFTVRFLARIYNTGTIKVSLNYTLPYHCTSAHTKSSNHTLSLHRSTSNSSSTLTEVLCAVLFPFFWLNSDIIPATSCRCIDSARTQRKTEPVLLMMLFYRSVA